MRLTAIALLLAVLAACDATDPPKPDAAPPKSCTGKPLACATFASSSDCAAQLGCHGVPAQCGGTARACSYYLDELSCGNQPHCYWYPSLAECDGVRSCDAQTDDLSCGRISGCTWSSYACSGDPEGCSLFSSATDCLDQLGCDWK